SPSWTRRRPRRLRLRRPRMERTPPTSPGRRTRRTRRTPRARRWTRRRAPPISRRATPRRSAREPGGEDEGGCRDRRLQLDRTDVAPAAAGAGVPALIDEGDDRRGAVGRALGRRDRVDERARRLRRPSQRRSAVVGQRTEEWVRAVLVGRVGEPARRVVAPVEAVRHRRTDDAV